MKIYSVKFNIRYRYHGPYLPLYSINCTGGLTRGPKYHNQTFLNLQISPQYRKHYSFSSIGKGTKNIILIYDCISYVDDPDHR